MRSRVPARVAGWGRLRNLPGPLAVAQSPPLGGEPGAPLDAFPTGRLQILVELFLGGGWVDITSFVYTRDTIAIRRGRSSEGTVVDPASCNLTVNNRDGRFSPRNPTGPYFGQLGRNTPIRVRAAGLYSAGWRTRFTGELAALPQKWDTTGTDVYVPLEAAGILRRLAQGASPLASTLYRRLTTLSTSPVAYWPAEDGEDSTSIASAIVGARAMTAAGTPDYRSSTAFPAAAAVLKLDGAALVGTVPAIVVPAGSTTPGIQLRFLLQIPDGGSVNGAVLFHLFCSGTASRWTVTYTTAAGGTLTLTAVDSAGVNILTASGLTGFDGLATRISLELSQPSGAPLEWNLQYVENAAGTAGTSGDIALVTIGRATQVQINPGKTMTDVAVGHVSVRKAFDANHAASAADLAAEYAAFAGETAGARIQRLCGEEGIPVAIVGDAADTEPMGAQTVATLLALLQEAADADLGVLHESRGELGLAYRTRTSLYNRSARLTLDYTAHQMVDLQPVDDDQAVRNDVTVTRRGGTSARAQQLTGRLSVLPPPDGVGRYDEAVTVSLEHDSQAGDAAGWRLHLGTVDEARYPTVGLRRESPAVVAAPALSEAVLDLDVGDRLDVTNLPAWMPPEDAGQGVLGYSEVLWQFEHSIAVNCAPASPYQVALYDRADRYSSDGSTLNQDVTAGATSFFVLTQSASFYWTVDPAEFPFDVLVGGERMTVTDIDAPTISDGTASQQFTVTRSANGVVKAHASGTELILFQPATYAI